jgi:UDP-N-acetylglucosamine 2-epimerase (non-hydrolysing)
MGISKKKIDIIVGARPNFMKVASLFIAAKQSKKVFLPFKFRLVHTGQHYDPSMSGAFFEQLGIPQPDINLEVGSGSQAEQTAGIMIGYEKLLQQDRADLCIVVGDVNSTMACAITAQKNGVKVAHIEAGIRSGDWSMPEEINRMVTDAITDYFFTTSETANQNLQALGVSKERIFFVGNTMIDTLLHHIGQIRSPSFWGDLDLSPKSYFVLTLHRPGNVDQSDGFRDLLQAIGESARGVPVIFPVHPRSLKKVREIGEVPENIHLVEPQPYLEFTYLVKNAKAVITDSGGITEEATVLDIPCMTLRDSTERPETISVGSNELVGTRPENIKPFIKKLFDGTWKRGGIPEKWDGQAGLRILTHLEKILHC